MRRYLIRMGDKTAAGGVVIQADERMKHHGVAVSYHGAKIYCHACKSVGHIRNVLPYRPMSIMGKQVALDNDICICKCNPLPRLITSQNTASMSFDGEELRRMGFDAFGRPLVNPESEVGFDDKFQLLDAGTGKPLSSTEYAIERANGEIEHGVTDINGRTHLLSTTAQSESVHIYI